MAITKPIKAARALLLVALLLGCGLVQAKKASLYLYNVPGEATDRLFPSNACQAAIEHYTRDCSGTFIVSPGCPAWSDLIQPPGSPGSNASIAWGFYTREFLHPCTGGFFDRAAYMTAFCGMSVNGTSYVYVGNGECRCPAPWVEDGQGNCVAACPAGTTLANGVCLADTPKSFGSDAACCTAGTNPINVGTGSKLHQESVYRALSVGRFSLQLTYNSRRLNYPIPVRETYFGVGWTSNLEAQVFTIATGAATVRRGDGKEIEFRPGAGGTMVADADIKDRLVRLTNGSGQTIGWEYHVQADESVEEYEPVYGRLTRVRFASGLQHVLTYSTASTPPNIAPRPGLVLGVADSFGRTLSFAYATSGRIVGMTDPASSQYTFEYDGPTGPAGKRNLTAITFPDTKRRVFHYAEPALTAGLGHPNALTGITDENGVRFASYGYDAQARAISTEHAGGASHVSMAHNGNGTSTVTDPRGNQRIFSFSSVLGVLKNTGISGSVGPEHGPQSRNYDANGNISSSIDWNGNRTNYAFDLSRNLETSRTEGLTSAGATTPQTRTITTAWHATFRKPTQTAEPLRLTTFTYDPDGTQCGAKAALCSKTIQATSDTDGSQGLSVTPLPSELPRVWTYTYNANGSVLTVNGPRTDLAGIGDTTTYTYYANDDGDPTKRGNLATITNAAGHPTSITAYNAHGQPLTVTDPNGMATTLTYDVRQRLKTRDAGGELTSYDYDWAGQLTKVTLPDGSFLTYDYDDAHRLTELSDNLGNRITYGLDAMGNRTLEQVFDPASQLAQKRSRVYSTLNRLFRELGAQDQTTEYGYDDQGNVLTVKDPLNRITTNEYDALNRLKKVTSPSPISGITQYAYNGLDALTQVTDARDLITGYAVNGLGNLTQQVSPDTGTTVNTYDAAGNLLTQTDAKSQLTTYVYDPLNRVTSITFHDGSKQTYAYDQGTNGIGRLSSIVETNPGLQVTSQTDYAYDLHGRVTSETRTISGIQYPTQYTYETGSGRLTGVTYPSGRTLTYGFDGLGRVNQITTTKGSQSQVVVQNVAYHPFGGVKGYTLGNGRVYTRNIDLDGRINSYTLGDKQFSVGHDEVSRIAFIAQTNPPPNPPDSNTNNYYYDNLDRLTSAIIPGSSHTYGYDPVGNRMSRTAGASADTYTYSPSSNRITSITGSVVRNFNYDPNGSTVADGNNTYIYDVRGRMFQATSALGVTTYQINALGQRIRKSNSLGDTTFHYDTAGRLIAETGPGGSSKREIIYLGDIPVGVVQ